MVTPQIVLLTSRHDFASDYIVAQLRDRDQPYLRLNSEDLGNLEITLDPVRQRLWGVAPTFEFCISADTLRWIVFRRPAFPREGSSTSRTPAERFAKLQWAAFSRALMVFDAARWMNHPVATYRAETKPLQLLLASRVGFSVVPTLISNSTRFISGDVVDSQYVVVKSLDTALLRWPDHETFTYTQLLHEDQIHDVSLADAPVIIQRPIHAKVDVRVTVVGSQLFAASILENGHGIHGDWRVRKSAVEFRSYDLPAYVAKRCWALTETLGLTFAAIDLAVEDENYHFLEVNPTGEWAWLIEAAGLPIDRAIADLLM